MVKISNINVYDLKECILACRNAMRTELLKPEEKTEDEYNKSLARAIKLAACPSNSGHPNFLTGIRVSFDIIYPNYISPELQRYHWIDIVTSSSKMHRLSEMVVKESFNEYVLPEAIELVKRLAAEFNLNPTYENRIRLLSNCPQGIELFMRVSTNYMQLRNVYHQRKDHRLKEDWGAICDMIKELPYFKEFIEVK